MGPKRCLFEAVLRDSAAARGWGIPHPVALEPPASDQYPGRCQAIAPLPASPEVSWMNTAGRSPGGGQRNPLQYFCLENPMDKGAWRVHSVADWLKWLSTHAHLQSIFSPHPSPDFPWGYLLTQQSTSLRLQCISENSWCSVDLPFLSATFGHGVRRHTTHTLLQNLLFLSLAIAFEGL